MQEREIHIGGGSYIESGVNVGSGESIGRDKVVHGDEVHGDKVMGDKVVVGRSQVEELHDYLARAVAAYEARMYQVVARPPAPPEQPYKFLYPFEVEDEGIFFGRERAVEGLYQKLTADRLTVLHARSGAGKTSLLNAGLSPCLIRQGRLPVYARAYEGPALAIKRAIAPPSLGPWPELLPKFTLHEFLGLACQHLGRQTQELVIILDQFEEFFVSWPEQDHRQPFVDALSDCYDDKLLPVRLIVALRKDYYSDLATFQGRLPHIFHNEYYLKAMTRQEAQTAIAGPVAKLGRPVTYEPELLDMLLDDLARGGMELPHLQIICARLYETLAEGESAITLACYEELGRAAGVLGGYLNDVLNKLPGQREVVAKEVLKELVSSEATRRVLSYDDLAVRVEAVQSELDDVLARLVSDRLLRRDEVAGQVVYEMAHEYLIEEIKKWIDQADLAFKQAEELLIREVANWRVHGTVIPKERLELLYDHRERLRGLEDETWRHIVRSALQANFAVADWARLAGVNRWGPLIAALGNEGSNECRTAVATLINSGASAVEPLTAALRNEDHVVRRVAAGILGRLKDPRAVESLIHALQDEDNDVRRAAAGALKELRDPRAVGPLIDAMHDDDRNVYLASLWALMEFDSPNADPFIIALQDENIAVRRAAVGALGRLRDPRAVELLIAVLGDESLGMRWEAAAALEKIGKPAVEPLIAVLGDENSSVHWEAAAALEKIGTPEALAAVEKWRGGL
jgi:hypothetical protein